MEDRESCVILTVNRVEQLLFMIYIKLVMVSSPGAKSRGSEYQILDKASKHLKSILYSYRKEMIEYLLPNFTNVLTLIFSYTNLENK